MKLCHLIYVPFTGLGRYEGFRGNRWLANRITVFKQYTLPSILNQSNRDFTLWISWRKEEKGNPLVDSLYESLQGIADLRVVFTYHGVCFWDDKYQDNAAAKRLTNSLIGSLSDLTDTVGDAEYVLMTIQPSDDCYRFDTFQRLQSIEPGKKSVGFQNGYLMNYETGEIKQYNPTTCPPFFTLYFPKEEFLNPQKHFFYTGPYKSHEYLKDYLPMTFLEDRGFLVGTHGENISTYFNHPYGGKTIEGMEKEDVLYRFGLDRSGVVSLKKRTSWIVKKLINSLPYTLRHYVLIKYIKWYDTLHKN